MLALFIIQGAAPAKYQVNHPACPSKCKETIVEGLTSQQMMDNATSDVPVTSKALVMSRL